MSGRACAACLRRAWLLGRLAAHLERAREQGRRLPLVLALDDAQLLAALGGAEEAAIRADLARFDPASARAAVGAAGLVALCRCDPGYPDRLRGAPDAPAVIHVAGDQGRFAALVEAPAVAVVGARRASAYGLDVASALGRGLAAAGVTVVSGMALGIDAAAHEGALASTGTTLAVLAGGADRPYPASKRGLYRRIRERGAALSELPPGAPPWRWCFPARNRVIAGLAEVTVVVEGGERSGSLITADFAGELGREVAAVPGRVSSPLAEGPNGLIVSGAHPVRHAADVLDLLFGPGRRPPPPPAPALPGRLQELLDAVAGGADSVGALVGRGVALADVLAALGHLELLGRVRRTPDGRYVARAADAPGDQAPGSSSPASSSPSC